ncbi:hypothetical protein D3C86_1782370 [compost metagenome]
MYPTNIELTFHIILGCTSQKCIKPNLIPISFGEFNIVIVKAKGDAITCELLAALVKKSNSFGKCLPLFLVDSWTDDITTADGNIHCNFFFQMVLQSIHVYMAANGLQ